MISGGPCTLSNQVFRGGRPVFQGGQAPSGPLVIRPLFVHITYSHLKSKLAVKVYEFVNLLLTFIAKMVITVTQHWRLAGPGQSSIAPESGRPINEPFRTKANRFISVRGERRKKTRKTRLKFHDVCGLRAQRHSQNLRKIATRHTISGDKVSTNQPPYLRNLLHIYQPLLSHSESSIYSFLHY